MVEGLQALRKSLQFGVVLHTRIQLAQACDAGKARELVMQTGQRAHARTGGLHGQAVSLPGQGLFAARALLRQQIAKPGQFVKTQRLQRVAHQPVLIPSLAQQGLGRQHQAGLRLLLVVDGAAHRGKEADRTDAGGLAVLGREVVASADAQFGGHAGQLGQHGEFRAVQRADRAAQLLVHQAVGAGFVQRAGQGRVAQFPPLKPGQGRRHIGERDLGQNLRVVFLRLAFQQRLRLLRHRIQRRGRHALAQRREARFFGLAAPL